MSMGCTKFTAITDAAPPQKMSKNIFVVADVGASGAPRADTDANTFEGLIERV